MSIPVRYQHRVLFWGIFGALALRAVFILIGAALIDRFSWLLVVFGVFLVFTGLRIIRHKDDEGDTDALVRSRFAKGVLSTPRVGIEQGLDPRPSCPLEERPTDAEAKEA